MQPTRPSSVSGNAQASVIGIGVDIVQIERIHQLLSRWPERGVTKLFTKVERNYCNRGEASAQHYAGRFAVKEAVFKALGTGWDEGVSWRQVEVWNRESGAPAVRLRGRAKQRFEEIGGRSLSVSISHTAEHAVGMAIVLGVR